MEPRADVGRRSGPPRSGNRDAFHRFVDVDGDRLLHAAYALCGDWQHAEDLVQAVLIIVARRWERIADNPTGYAYRCLVRANIDRWRVRRRRPEVPVAPSAVSGLQHGVVSDDVERRLSVAAALQGLPPRQRAIVVLRYLQDLSTADTAAALGISQGAVKSGAARALARLRDTYPLEDL